MTIDTRRYSRRRDLIAQTVDGELVILDVAAKRVHQLNATASRIWDECEGAISADELARRLIADFDEAPDAALVRHHVVDTLATFERLGLVMDAAQTPDSEDGGRDDAQG